MELLQERILADERNFRFFVFQNVEDTENGKDQAGNAGKTENKTGNNFNNGDPAENSTENDADNFGKGGKQRKVYFDAKTKVHLERYLQSRTDDNPSLFVSKRKPHKRLTVGGVEKFVQSLGNKAGVSNVHPHRFRRTVATVAIDKGMPIEQVQHLLGHTQIDTTLHYAIVDDNNVKNSHKKFLR